MSLECCCPGSRRPDLLWRELRSGKQPAASGTLNHSSSGVSNTIGNRPGRALLITDVPRVGLVTSCHGRSCSRRSRPSPSPSRSSHQSHARARIALEVEPPGGRQVLAAEGADHDEVGAVPEVRERGRPRLARFAPGRREEKHWHPDETVEDASPADAVGAGVNAGQCTDQEAPRSFAVAGRDSHSFILSHPGEETGEGSRRTREMHEPVATSSGFPTDLRRSDCNSESHQPQTLRTRCIGDSRDYPLAGQEPPTQDSVQFARSSQRPNALVRPRLPTGTSEAHPLTAVARAHSSPLVASAAPHPVPDEVQGHHARGEERADTPSCRMRTAMPACVATRRSISPQRAQRRRGTRQGST